MRSSEGLYFEKLDHLRGLAALLVFLWHYIYLNKNISQAFVTDPVFMPFERGHLGVSLFMVLSGYLFAKILSGRNIDYAAFLWNRVLRLFPLLIFVAAIVALQKFRKGGNLNEYELELLQGFVAPSWPNGGWSIAVELHFYLVLPLLLYFNRKDKFNLLIVVAAMITMRTVLYVVGANIGWLSYHTIIGRLDQFVIGISLHSVFYNAKIKSSVMLATSVLMGLFYMQVVGRGVFLSITETAIANPVWIVLQTIEGLYFGMLIIWYEKLDIKIPITVSRALAIPGTLSYSAYLLHPFFYQQANGFMRKFVYGGDNIYGNILTGCLAFICLLPIFWVTYNLLEKSFLRWRKIYTKTMPVQLKLDQSD